MLLVDESAFSKKGEASVGVARQYNGRLGKVDNCQVGVFATLSFETRSTLIGSRLYLPEAWIRDQKRCERLGIPKACRVHRTKPELAWDLIETIASDGVAFDDRCYMNIFAYSATRWAYCHNCDRGEVENSFL